jgi:hypothetical protein
VTNLSGQKINNKIMIFAILLSDSNKTTKPTTMSSPTADSSDLLDLDLDALSFASSLDLSEDDFADLEQVPEEWLADSEREIDDLLAQVPDSPLAKQHMSGITKLTSAVRKSLRTIRSKRRAGAVFQKVDVPVSPSAGDQLTVPRTASKTQRAYSLAIKETIRALARSSGSIGSAGSADISSGPVALVIDSSDAVSASEPPTPTRGVVAHRALFGSVVHRAFSKGSMSSISSLSSAGAPDA